MSSAAIFGGSSSGDSDSADDAAAGVAYLQAIGDVGADQFAPPPRPPRPKRVKLTALQKRERRREAQKRITREQQARIRMRAERHVAACAEREAEEAERELWQAKMRKIQSEAFGGEDGEQAPPYARTRTRASASALLSSCERVGLTHHSHALLPTQTTTMARVSQWCTLPLQV